MISWSPIYPFLGKWFMVNIKISESCFCILCVRFLTCLSIINFFLFQFFDGAYLSIDFVFIRKVLISVCFYMVFTSIFIHNHFLSFLTIFAPKTGFYKCNTGGTLWNYFVLSDFAEFFHCYFSRTLYFQISM